MILGPRIYPLGAFISQTGGHGDFRLRHEPPRGTAGYFGHRELLGAAAIADGDAEVTRAAREQLMLDARPGRAPGGAAGEDGALVFPSPGAENGDVGHAALLGLSGPRNPYPGKLGVVAEGALAGLLLLDGNPLEDIHLLGDPGRTLLVIMKDGNIVKNALSG